MPDQGVAAALALAARVHEGQTDKAGVPYLHHVVTVALTVPVSGTCVGNAAKIVALLHDSIEDAGDPDAVREEIAATFGDGILALVERMTHRQGETYADYIERIAETWITRDVKIADLRHNLDATRLGGAVNPKQATYEAALDRLINVRIAQEA